MWWAGLLLALVTFGTGRAGSPPERLERRESVAEVAPLLEALRGIRARPAIPDTTPVRLYVLLPALTPERRAALETAGLQIEVPAPGAAAPRWWEGEVVQGLATGAVRQRIAALPFVRGVESPGEAWPSSGTVDGAGDVIHGGPVARAVLGTDGAGASVGVISDGADDRAASIASGDLPADLELPPISGLSSGNGDEGTAMLEVLYDLAPGAHLLFAPARTSVEMVVAIDGLAAAGARVIVDDLVFTDEPKFEDGPIAAAAQRFVAGGGIYVTAAGNYARSHYLAPYRPAGGTTFGSFTYPAVHAFASRDVGNSFRLPAGAQILAVLQWNDRFGHAADDFDLILATPGPGGPVLLAASTNVQNGTGDPIEAVRYVNRSGAAQDLFLAVGEFSRVTPVANLRLNLIVFSQLILPLQYAVPRESILGHAAVEEVLSVAAANAATPDTVESFSSNGPATIFFPAHTVRSVPRLTAVDDVETAVGRRGVFPNPFRGTSASAPDVAGCAALLLAAGVPAPTATSALVSTALDLLSPGFDVVSGAGLLDCAAAARLATGKATAPVVGSVQAAFDPDAAIAVDASGEDAEGDVRTATVRLLASGGDELATQTVDVVTSGTAYTLTAAFRGAPLARARSAAVQVSDATHLTSIEVQAALTCPGDGSLGDVLCGIGDLLAVLDPVPGRRARAIEAAGRAAARGVVRAGTARAGGRSRAARHRITVATAHVRAALRRAAHLPADPGVTVVAHLMALRADLLTLRQTFQSEREPVTGDESGGGASGLP